MPRYEVELEIDAIAWVEVEADDAAEAIEAAKATIVPSAVDWWEVSDASAKEYAA